MSLTDQEGVSDAVRIRANIAKMRAMGAPKADIDAYIAEEDAATKAQGKAEVDAASYDDNAPLDRAAGVGKAALQGASFGWSDEALGGMRALAERRPYAETVAEERGDLDRFRKAHGGVALGAELVGGLATAIPGGAAAAAKGVGTAAKVARTAGVGAGYGAAAGAGAGEGLEGKAKGAGYGAAAGAVLGPAVAGLAKGAGAIGTRIADAVPGIRAKGATLAEQLQNRPGALNLGANESRLGIASSGQRADDKILEAVQAGGKDVAGVRSEFEQRLLDGPKPEVLGDFAGEPVQNLTRTAHTLPGEGRARIATAMESRAKGAETRVIDDILETTKAKGRINIRKAIDDLATEREAEAEKLYGAIYDQPVGNPELGRFFDLPEFQKAYKLAQGMEKTAAVAKGARGKSTLPPLEKVVDENGNLTEPLTVRQIDRIKRGIDEVLDAGPRSPLDAGGIGKESMAGLRDAKNAFLAEVDAVVPEYKAARDAFAGKSAMMRALDEGRTLWSQPIEEIEGRLAEMTQSEKDAFTKGAVEALSQKVESLHPGHDINYRIANTTLNQRRLRLLFPDDAAFEKALARLQREGQMHKTKLAVTGGSQTADKLMSVVDMFTPPSVPMNASGFMAKGLDAAKRHLIDRNSKQLSADLAERLAAGADGNSQAVRTLLDALAEAEQRQGQRGGTARVGQRAASNVGGQRTNRP